MKTTQRLFSKVNIIVIIIIIIIIIYLFKEHYKG